MNKSTYSTYRCTTSDLGKYALIGQLKYNVENLLNVFPIFVTFKASISSNRYYDEAIYSLRIWLEGSTVAYNLVEVSSSKLMDFCLDVDNEKVYLYCTTNSVAGGRITIEELESTSSGFMEWKNFEKFTKENFIKKVTPTRFDKIFNALVQFSKDININGSVTLNKGSSVAPVQVQREQSNGDVIEGDMFVTSNGKLFLGLRGKTSDTLGNENNTGIRFTSSQVEFIGNITPSITNKNSLGTSSYKFTDTFTGQVTFTPVLSLPTTGVSNGTTVFNATIKKLCTYYNGTWYDQTGTAL